MAKLNFHKVIIGRAELLHFMDFAINDIPAKVDTGAFSSSVHADHIVCSDDGKTLEFRLLGGHPIWGKLATTITTEAFRVVSVSNSFGHSQERYIVRLRVKIGPKIFTTDFTLADRGKMTYPILLGRKMLNNRFLVDTAYSQVDRNALKRQYAIDIPADEEAHHEPSNSI